MNKNDLLAKAAEHIFATGLRDSGSKLCLANMKYGIAKIHYIQEKLGLKPDATFISTPDMTVTRNSVRWGSGFGYGGKISWGDGTQELIVLNTKPNTCGMLVGGLDKAPSSEMLIKKINEISKENLYIDGVKIELDFRTGNHFIDIFRVKPVVGYSFPKYAFIIHGAGDELRGETKLGDGLYFDTSKKLAEKSEVFDTPFGTLNILQGNKAKEYYEFYCYVDSFSKRRRELVAERLFGEYTLIANETHQGLINYNEILLGCHNVSDEKKIFPLTLKGDLPAYLVRGIKNLSPEGIELLGFSERAKRLGVYNKLCNANIIPHGGGYVFPEIIGVKDVLDINGVRYFKADIPNDRGENIFSDVSGLPFQYRGKEVILKSVELKLLEICAKLIPIYVLKV